MKEIKIMTHFIVNNVARKEIENLNKNPNNNKLADFKYVMIILYQDNNTNIKDYIFKNENAIDKMSGINGLVFPITESKILSKNSQYDYLNLGKRINGFTPEVGQTADIYQNDLYKTVFSDLPYVIIIDTETGNANKFKIDPTLSKEEIGTKFGYMFDVLNEKKFSKAVALISLDNIWGNCKKLSVSAISGIISILISLWKP